MFLGEIVSLKSDDEASLESDPLCGGAPERNAHHRPIKVNDLWNHIKEMKLNRCVGFKREYEVKHSYDLDKLPIQRSGGWGGRGVPPSCIKDFCLSTKSLKKPQTNTYQFHGKNPISEE